MVDALAMFGGTPAVTTPQPHEVWPPLADLAELDDLVAQRNCDISIKGRTGPILRLEQAFRSFLGCLPQFVVSFNSGTSALTAAYVGLGLGPGDEVIGPALTFHAALSPLFLLGAEPVLVDIERDSRCIDPDAIEAAITPRTKAVTVVHQWGHPADMDAVLRIVRKHDLRLVEDCSHAHGSRYKGKPCGTFGDVAVFSLQANKAVYAGEGGLLVTSDPRIHARATLLGHYRDRSRDELKTTDDARFWVTGYGQKLRMSPLNAVVAIHALRHFPQRREGRHVCLNHFRRRLAEISYIEPPWVSPEVDMGGWYGFKPLVLPARIPGVTRATLVRALAAEGVEVAAPSGGLLAREPLFAEPSGPIFGRQRAVLPPDPAAFPVASHVESWSLSLPTFYRPVEHIPLIDQYINAFKKIQSWAPLLATGQHSRRLAEPQPVGGV
jgi:dTDP-4-amino-4,6-dideoxygalactose transaminase